MIISIARFKKNILFLFSKSILGQVDCFIHGRRAYKKGHFAAGLRCL